MNLSVTFSEGTCFYCVPRHNWPDQRLPKGVRADRGSNKKFHSNIRAGAVMQKQPVSTTKSSVTD